MKVLAIDPGYERLGIAVLEKKTGPEELLFSECFQTRAKDPHSRRLSQIWSKIDQVIRDHRPEIMAIETLFFSVNQKTALKVAESRGVVIAAAANWEVEVREFSPQAVKIAVTGNGASDKRQIVAILPKLLHLPENIGYDDVYDAIAVGLACLASTTSFTLDNN